MIGVGTQEIIILSGAITTVGIIVGIFIFLLKKAMSIGKIIGGAIYLIIGLSIYLWASSHSPNMSYGEMLTKMDTYILKQPAYNIIIILAAIFGIGGIVLIIQGVISSNTLKSPTHASFCSGCGAKVSQEDTFCSECGHSLR